MQRSFLVFENCIKSQETLKRYKYYLDIFIKFFHLKDYDSLAVMDSKQLQIILEAKKSDRKICIFISAQKEAEKDHPNL